MAPGDPVSHGRDGSLTGHLRHGLNDELLELQSLALQLLKVLLQRPSILGNWDEFMEWNEWKRWYGH